MDYPYVSSLAPAGGGSGATMPYVEYETNESNEIIGAKFYCENAIPRRICHSLASLKAIDLSKCKNLTSIGSYAFFNCNKLELTKLPSGITSIGYQAFYFCSNITLTELPNGITSIEQETFAGCAKLALTELPSGITSIKYYAFENCRGLTSLTFKGTASSIANNAFNDCSNLLDIYVPWAEGAVAYAPWGATNATIHYNSAV